MGALPSLRVGGLADVDSSVGPTHRRESQLSAEAPPLRPSPLLWSAPADLGPRVSFCPTREVERLTGHHHHRVGCYRDNRSICRGGAEGRIRAAIGFLAPSSGAVVRTHTGR